MLTVLLNNPIGSNTPSLNFISFSIYQGNNILENFVNEELTSYVAEEGMIVGGSPTCNDIAEHSCLSI